jgi:hypothetical protein
MNILSLGSPFHKINLSQASLCPLLVNVNPYMYIFMYSYVATYVYLHIYVGLFTVYVRMYVNEQSGSGDNS